MKKDVELVIRARDEASRAGNAIADTLDRLARAAKGAGNESVASGSKIDVLGAALGKIQTEYRAIDSAVTGAEAAFRRQNATLDDTRAQQQAVTTQAVAAKQALERLKAETVADGDAKVAQAAKIKQVEAAYASLIRQNAVLTTSVERQEVALNSAGLAMQRLGSQSTAAEIAVVEAALQRSVGVTKELAAATVAQTHNYAEMAREAREVAAAQAAQDAQRGINASFGIGAAPGRSAQDSAAFFREQIAIAERIKASVDPLTASQNRYNAEVAEANALYGAGLLKADELALHLRRLEAQARETGKALTSTGGRGERGKVGLFGLKPYEVQNLAYQINDLFTQIASGTSVTQTLAQQGGQIGQIFAGANSGQFFAQIGASALRAAPLIGLVVTALVAVGGALKNIGDLSSSERTFGGLLGASADGGLYNAKDLAATAHELDMLGGSLKDARKEVSALVQAGVSETFLEPMAISAARMAKILGIDVVDAAKLAGEAFTGGFKEIQKLDKATNVYTKTQLDHIEALFKEGKASEARTYAFSIWTAKMDAGADKMEGRWAKAMRTFGGVWDFLLNKIGDSSAIQSILKWIDKLITTLDIGLSKMARLRAGSALARVETQQADLQTELEAARKYNSPAEAARRKRREEAQLGAALGSTGPSFGSLIPTTPKPRSEAQIQADIAAADARRKTLLGGTTDTRAAGSEQGTKEDADRAEKDAKKAAAAAAKAAREAAAAASKAEAAQNAREAAAEGLQNALSSLEAKAEKVAMAPLDARLKAVDDEYARIQLKIKDALALGVKSIDGMSIADYQKRAEAAKDLLKQQAAMKFYAEGMKDLEDQRAARIKAINDQVADGTLKQADAYTQLDAINKDLSPQMEKMAQDALAFAIALRGAKPNPELEAFIARFQRVLGREATPGGKGSETAAEKFTQLAGVEREINDLVSQRNDLVQSAEELAARGASSYEDMEARIKKAYEGTTPAIEERIATIRRSLDALKAAGEIDPTAYDAWLAKLDLIKLGTEDVHHQVLSIADANSMLVDVGVSAWDRFFQSVEAGKNVLTAFWDSLKQSAADLLRDLSGMIVKAMLMRAVMKSGIGKYLSAGINGAFDPDGAKSAAAALAAAGGILNSSAAALMAAAVALREANAGGGGFDAVKGFAGSLLPGGAAPSGGSFWTKAASMALSFFHHSGGIVGAGGSPSLMPASLWDNAVRFHNGGLPGLRSDEVATILQKGEEVLTSDNPRHVLNGGRSAAGGGNTKIVNLFDTGDFLDQALATERGERVLINHVTRNAGAFKAALGVG